MPLSLSIRNVRRLVEADLDLSGQICLIVGANEIGKTSAAQSAQAVLTSTAALLTGTKSLDGELMVTNRLRDGGRALLQDEGVHRAVFWPKCETSSKGHPDLLPHASRHAAGLERFAAMKPAERAACFAEVFKCAPTFKELEHALQEAEITGIDLQAEWKAIEGQGWDHAATVHAETAKGIKGEWRAVTQQNWGTSIGETWEPEGWDPGLEDATEEDLMAEVDAAHEKMEAETSAHAAAVAEAAVSDAERGRMEALVRELRDRQIRLESARRSLTDAQERLAAAREARQQLPATVEAKPTTMFTFACRDCGAVHENVYIDLKTHELAIWEGEWLTGEEIRKIRNEIAGADGLIGQYEGREQQAIAAIARAEQALEEAEAAAKRLAENSPPEKQAPSPADRTVTSAMPRAKAEFDAASFRLTMWRSWSKARDLNRQIKQHLALADILGPGGLRKKKLGDVLGMLNDSLADLSREMGMEPVRIDEDLNVWRGEWPYVCLSESAHWRVDAVLQIEIARRDGSSMVVLDRADVNDATFRNGLFNVLVGAGIKAMVCMTVSAPDPDYVPDLAAHGMGRTYWIGPDYRAVAVAEVFEVAEAAE